MERLKSVLARVLAVGEEKINDDSSPETINSWDSFNGLMLVSELETNFKIKFTMAEVMSVKNVKDIKSALDKHGVPKGVYE
jgi:acyl carrier protein